MSSRCFANNAQFLLEIRGALMALVNGNMDMWGAGAWHEA